MDEKVVLDSPTRSAVLAALAVAGSSIIGSVMQSNASSDASYNALMASKYSNDTNRKIAQETNQANLDLYREQYQDSLEFQDMQNAYNSPLNERNRLLEAGLNPALNFGSGASVGNVSLPSSHPMVGAEMQQAPFEAYNDASGMMLSKGISDALDNLSKFEDFASKNTDNQFRFERNKKELATMDAELSSRLASTDLTRVQRAKLLSEKQGIDELNRLNSARYDDMLAREKLQNQFMATQERVMREQDVRDTERLALEKLRTRSGIALDASNQRYLSQLTQNAFNLDLRASDSHLFEQGSRALDNALKRLQLSETEKQNLFNDVMRNTDLYHEGLKDASLINRVTERMFGLGFRDVGSALRALFR